MDCKVYGVGDFQKHFHKICLFTEKKINSINFKSLSNSISLLEIIIETYNQLGYDTLAYKRELNNLYNKASVTLGLSVEGCLRFVRRSFELKEYNKIVGFEKKVRALIDWDLLHVKDEVECLEKIIFSYKSIDSKVPNFLVKKLSKLYRKMGIRNKSKNVK